MPKHVSFETPIDWRQWKLDQSIRSLRMWVDPDGDLYAVPVVVVDPTGVAASARQPITPYTDFHETSVISGPPVQVASPPLLTNLDIYGMRLDLGIINAAVAAPFNLRFYEAQSGRNIFITRIWVPLAAYPHEIIFDFSAHPIHVPWMAGGNPVYAEWSAAFARDDVFCTIWGHAE